MTPTRFIKRSSALAVAYLSAFAAAATAQAATPWVPVDIFSDGSGLSDQWVKRGAHPISMEVVNDVLQVRVAGFTQGANIPLPTGFANQSRHFTISFDFFMPVDPARENAIGFGVSSDRFAAASGWGSVGNLNRFQTANPAPQQLVLAGDWNDDLLAPVTGSTLQGTWYNIWLVYDLDAGETGTISFWAVTERDEAPPTAPIKTRALGTNATENLSADGVSHFGVAVGTIQFGDLGGQPSLGGNFGDIYIAQGQVIEFTPTQRRNPLVWTALDTFDNGSPNANWVGDLDRVALDFSENRLKISGATADSLPSIRVPLPESMQVGQFTIAFDLMIPANQAWLNLGAVSFDDVASTDVRNRVGGADRILTFPQTATAAQRLTVQSQQSNTAIDLLSPTTLGEWYHVWLVYNVSGNLLEVYSLPFGAPGDPVRTLSQTISARSSYDFFALGIGRGLGSSATGTGFEIDNIYFAPGELLDFSPTAGQLGGGGTEPGPESELPEQWAAAFENRDQNGWFWLSFNQDEPQSLTGVWAWSEPQYLNWVFLNGIDWVYVFGNNEPNLFLFSPESGSWYFTSLVPSEYKFFFSFEENAWVAYLAPGGELVELNP